MILKRIAAALFVVGQGKLVSLMMRSHHVLYHIPIYSHMSLTPRLYALDRYPPLTIRATGNSRLTSTPTILQARIPP